MKFFAAAVWIFVTVGMSGALKIVIADDGNTDLQAAASSVYRLGEVCIDSPWAFDSLDKKVAAAFMKLSVREGHSDRLIGAVSPQAMRVEIHDILNQDGVMMMQEAEAQVLGFSTASPLELKPHGLHVMLMGLHQPLKPGSTLQLTLEFEKSGTIDIDVAVRALSDSPITYTSACD